MITLKYLIQQEANEGEGAVGCRLLPSVCVVLINQKWKFSGPKQAKHIFLLLVRPGMFVWRRYATGHKGWGQIK